MILKDYLLKSRPSYTGYLTTLKIDNRIHSKVNRPGQYEGASYVRVAEPDDKHVYQVQEIALK